MCGLLKKKKQANDEMESMANNSLNWCAFSHAAHAPQLRATIATIIIMAQLCCVRQKNLMQPQDTMHGSM